MALVQLARIRGARVVALTSGPKVEGIRELGADVAIDRGFRDVRGAVMETTGGVDVVADVVGGGMFPELLETVRRGGHSTTAGAVAGPIVSPDLRTLYLNDLTMHGATVYPACLVREIGLAHPEWGPDSSGRRHIPFAGFAEGPGRVHDQASLRGHRDRGGQRNGLR